LFDGDCDSVGKVVAVNPLLWRRGLRGGGFLSGGKAQGKARILQSADDLG